MSPLEARLKYCSLLISTLIGSFKVAESNQTLQVFSPTNLGMWANTKQTQNRKSQRLPVITQCKEQMTWEVQIRSFKNKYTSPSMFFKDKNTGCRCIVGDGLLRRGKYVNKTLKILIKKQQLYVPALVEHILKLERCRESEHSSCVRMT